MRGVAPTLRGAVMVCGTTSDAGKSHVVTGLCRALARRGVRVAPFKAQNMSLNSFVTPSGHEIGRAQGVQALAARAEPEVAMNPVLLKPTGERTSQVVVMGRPTGHVDAKAYQERKAELFPVVLDALASLRRRFDVVVCEGAGSPAELNLASSDIVNLRLAERASLPAIVVGDIDRGGVFAALYGTVALLPAAQRELVKGFVVNKLRGDPSLLAGGPEELERLTGLPTLGVLPWVEGLELDAEDSLGLRRRPGPSRGEPARGDPLDVAALAFPRISNFTDLDALAIEPGVTVRLVSSPGELGRPDLVILPGTKSTVADLDWLRGTGLDRAIARSCGLTPGGPTPGGPTPDGSATVVGLCGGYQMMGRRVTDPGGVESARTEVEGLGWVDAHTCFEADKITRQRRGRVGDERVDGYEIHHGVTTLRSGVSPWVRLDDAYGSPDEGAAAGNVFGTSLHGIFESDGFRASVLVEVARRRGKRFVPAGACFAAAREAQIDRLADLLEAHLDLVAVEQIIAGGAPAGAAASEPRRADAAGRASR